MRWISAAMVAISVNTDTLAKTASSMRNGGSGTKTKPVFRRLDFARCYG